MKTKSKTVKRKATPKEKEACPKCKSKNTSSNGAGMWHCWACDHSWRGKDY